MREQTRKQRYLDKIDKVKAMPLSIVTVNFHCDENIAFIIRTAACFAVDYLAVIGSLPDRNLINNSSGSTLDFVKIIQFSTPSEYLEFARKNNIKIVAAELCDGAKSLYEYEFGFDHHTAIILGHETSGVPAEITLNHDTVYIPMPGLGFCLNTSQTGTAMVTEYSRQFSLKSKLS